MCDFVWENTTKKMKASASTCLLLVTFLLAPVLISASTLKKNGGHYLNQFAIQLKTLDVKIAEQVARQHGFVVKRELPHIKVFILEHPEVHHRSKRSATSHVERLLADERIAHAQQEVSLVRVKRRIVYDKQLELPIRQLDDSAYSRPKPKSGLQQRDDIYGGRSLYYDDPKFPDMWYLFNTGQSGGEHGLDMNVGAVWKSGFTGKGVVVCILDDGVDHTHPDLKENYDPKASTDLNDKSDKKGDPMPDTSDIDNSHGTRCAGEIAAAANNNVCGVGVAYEANIGGIRILDGVVTDSIEAEALLFRNDYIDIYSASWGPSDDGATMEGPRRLSLEALRRGVKEGRRGLGSIFVWATGNGGMFNDDCSADGYVSLPETLSVGSVNDWGRSPFFMENCSSTLAVVPSGGEDWVGQESETGVKLKVVTTDFKGGCIENFQGTSSAAPLAAGCLATVLQANPALTWRDVQHVVVRGSRVPSADSSWTINGAGRHVSHRFGFGLMDCGKMVELAQNWEPVPEVRECRHDKPNVQMLRTGDVVTDHIQSSGCLGHDDKVKGQQSIDRLEHVQVKVNMTTERRGSTRLTLVSPAGTESELLSARKYDEFSGEWEFTFMTVHCWDESPRGKWTLRVHSDPHSSKSEKHNNKDDKTDSVAGYIRSWSLNFRGTHGTRHGRDRTHANRVQRAFKPSSVAVQKIKSQEVEISKRVKVKRAEVKEDAKEVNEVEQREAREDLYRKLYDILHGGGARAVRKRVLGQTSDVTTDDVTTSDDSIVASLRDIAKRLVDGEHV